MNFDAASLDDSLVPPEELVDQQNIGQGSFKRIGEEMIGAIIRRGYLTPTDRILDVGSGLGRLARPLTSYLAKPGEYHGMEISKDSVDWCKAKYARHPNFRFQWIDVWSKLYNPQGAVQATNFTFPYEAAFFDFVLLASVFTHMCLEDTDHYLSEVARVLRPGGKCFITYFLISPDVKDQFEKHIREGTWFRIKGGAIQDREVPEKVVALREDAIKEIYQKYGLNIETVAYGTWCARTIKPLFGYQDDIWAIKQPSKPQDRSAGKRKKASPA